MAKNKRPIFKRGRHLKRYRQIISVLVKHGFGEFLSITGIEKVIHLGKEISYKLKGESCPIDEECTIWVRIRMAIEELGPTFIKFGQIMSNRPDLLPQELVDELEKLQDSVPPSPNFKAEETISEVLGLPLDQVFSEFEDEPKASASIAQVHRAVLLDGKEVAVKLRRPGIEEIINVDLEIMTHLAELLEKYISSLEIIHPTGIVKEFERVIKKEINFKSELMHIERFAAQFHDRDDIYVPAVYRKYSTETVLTMEYIRGTKLSDIIHDTDNKGHDGVYLAKKGSELYMEQVIRHGFFHADPHPGNILIIEDEVICFIDFGMMGTLPDDYRDIFADMMVAIVRKDYPKVTRQILKLAGKKHVENQKHLEMQIGNLVEDYYYSSLQSIRIADFLRRVLTMLIEYEIVIPPYLYLLVKTMITVEGFGKALDPKLELAEIAKPYAKEIIHERYSVKRFIKDFSVTAGDLVELLKVLPNDIMEISDVIKEGKIRIEVGEKSLGPIRQLLFRIANMLVFSVVLAALIIGSSVIIHAGVPPLWNNIPILGIIGFVVAGFIGFWLLFNIIRRGNLK